MGQAHSIAQSKPPPLSDDTDDSEEEEVLLLDPILGSNEKGGEEKGEEVSIVFFDEDEVDENDLYYDEDRNDSSLDDYKCFGLPFFSMTTQFPAISSPSDKAKSNNDEDEDEDPKENIESLQFELKVVDAFYNHHTRNSKKRTKTAVEEEKEEEEEQDLEERQIERAKSDSREEEEKSQKQHDEQEKEDAEQDEDFQDNVESLQRELEHAEEKFKFGVGNDCGNESNPNSPLFTEREHDDERSHRSSSFIDLQQLLFSPAVGEDNDDNSSSHNKMGGSLSSSCSASLFSSSSSKSCRIVEIYETRSTQLKPQAENEKEKVPIERMGIPFRKCRNPSCSCHHSSFKSRDNGRSRHRERNRAIIEKYHSSNNQNTYTDDEESNTSESSQVKRRSALHRLQKQREKLLAMDYSDEDDHTEVTAGSSSSSSRYSGYSIRSDCQINTRKNHIMQNNSNPNHLDRRRHRRQESQSEDFDERFTNGGRGNRRMLPETLKIDAAQMELSPSTATTQLMPSSDVHEEKLTTHHQNQQPTPPPLPSRRSFGSKSNLKHITYPPLLSHQRSQSLRKISSDSFFEDNTTGTPRRCRSEDFIDGTVNGNIIESTHNSKQIKDTRAVSESNHRIQSKKASFSEGSITPPNTAGKKRSFSAHAENMPGPTVIPDEEEVDTGRGSKDGRNSLIGHSPTCIMEDVHGDGSYPRSRTTQHQHENLLEQLDRIHQQPESPNTDSSPNRKARSGSINFDDDPCFSRLFHERERNLKEYRKTVRILQNEEKIDRCQKSVSTKQKTIRRDFHKEQKRIRHHHQQRCFQRAMKLADLYHNMGLIHYQQGRYETARHVLQCGVDALISNRASCVPFEQETFEEMADPFDEDYSNPYFACAPSRLLPLLPTVDEAAPHLSNSALLLAAELILAQGKILAAQGSWKETKESSGRVLQWSAFQKQRLDNASRQQQHHHHIVAEQHNKYWRDWGPTIARTQVLFARCCEKEHRPDLAMGYYQEALALQKSILSPEHIQAADTLYRMGNLHAASGLLGLAGQCYDEALCLYRRHKHLNGNDVEACVFADEATALAALGWIFLVQNDLERALALTKEALDGMIQALGSSHRNVFSLQHQLVCIQNSLAFPAHYSNR
eukprot:CAMPEP_0116128050 /NCGR_PEP_ID=MMETSP0329-20121206/7156_1 /TAXON_ID=697910 /ORGANISM="Pseudo-nitzschia arenysensis, Strain B593" /LENGTH=1125 /DNA_ID=CAMNT_0003622169 /DNA_START=424 /DNA_END=3801 /DNA_ORIENTATION=+